MQEEVQLMESISGVRVCLWDGNWFASEATRLGGEMPVDALMWIQSNTPSWGMKMSAMLVLVKA